MTNRALAFIVLLPIAATIGFAAGRATAPLGTVMRADSPKRDAHLRVDRLFSLRGEDRRVILAAGGEEIEIKRLDDQSGEASELVWAPDGSLAAALVNGSRLFVIDAIARRLIYELPLLEKMDGSRVARGVGFSSNAVAITFDDCPRSGAGCRPRLIGLPKRQ